MSRRCTSYAISTDRICRKKFSYIIQDKKLCCVHARLEFNKYALRIQKRWRGNRTRSLVKKVYAKLPDEIQQKILFYVRKNHLIKKHHHEVITRILDNKFERSGILHIVHGIKINGHTNLFRNTDINILALIYKLYTKYIAIAPPENLKFLNYHTHDVLYSQNYYNDQTNNFTEMAIAIKKFKNIYMVSI